MSSASTLSTPNVGRVPTLSPRRPIAGATRPPARQRLQSRPRTRNTEEPFVNVGDAERMLSTIGGGALALYGLSRGNLGGLALAAVGGGLIYRGLSGHCSLYGQLGVSTAEKHGPMTSIPAGAGCKVEKVVTINRPAEDLYRFWRNFENLPSFMSHLKSVKVDGNRSHWVAKAPLGMSAEWDAEIITDRRGEVISWRSVDDSEVDTAGSVHFTPAHDGRGTQVRVVLKYDPPAGKVGATLARWLGESPEYQIEEDLNAFKRLMEAGESPATRGQPAAR